MLDMFTISQPGKFMLAWAGDYVYPDNFLRELFQSSAVANVGNFSNAEYEALEARATEISEPLE